MSARNGRVSRDILAFRSLLEDNTEEGNSPPGHRNPSRKAAAKKNKSLRGKAGTTAVPGFALRDAQRHNSGASPTGSLPGISLLTEMFPQVDRVIIAEVWDACGSSMEATTDALLSMGLGGGGDNFSSGSSDGPSTGPHDSKRPHMLTLRRGILPCKSEC